MTLALDLPIFTSFKNLADYQSSRKSHLAALSRREEGERGLIAELRNVVAGVRSAIRALEASEAEARQAEELFENTANRRDQGMASYTELVDARVLRDRARIGAVDALYDCFLALSDTERVLGAQTTTLSGDEP